MKFKVYQNRSIAKALDNGIPNTWEHLEKSPGVSEYRTVAAGGSKNWKPEMALYWQHVATIDADDLDNVFEIGNIGPESKILRHAPMSSVSVGNIIVGPIPITSGIYKISAHMVDPLGFKEIEFKEVYSYGPLAYAL